MFEVLLFLFLFGSSIGWVHFCCLRDFLLEHSPTNFFFPAIRYPANITLLRGNHESRQLTQVIIFLPVLCLAYEVIVAFFFLGILAACLVDELCSVLFFTKFLARSPVHFLSLFLILDSFFLVYCSAHNINYDWERQIRKSSHFWLPSLDLTIPMYNNPWMDCLEKSFMDCDGTPRSNQIINH